MASIGLLGFVKGASGRTLDMIDKREEEDKAKRLQDRLVQLQREQAEWNLTFTNDNAIDDKKYDPTSNTFTNYSKSGKQLGEAWKGTDSDLAAYKAGQDKLQRETDKELLGMDNTRSEMASRKIRDSNDTLSTRASVTSSYASADYSRAAAAKARSLDGGGGSGAAIGVNQDYMAGDELLNLPQIKGLAADAARAGVDQELLSEAAASAAREAGTNPKNTSSMQRAAEASRKLQERIRYLKVNYAKPPKD